LGSSVANISPTKEIRAVNLLFSVLPLSAALVEKIVLPSVLYKKKPTSSCKSVSELTRPSVPLNLYPALSLI